MKLWHSRSLSFVLLLGLSTASASENARDNRKVSLGLIAGMPDMIGVQVKAEGVPNFEFGGSIGSFSMDPILRSRVPLSGVPVNLGLPDSYEIVPTASFNLFDVSIFARYFPWSTGFFTQIGFDWWHFGTNFTGDLKDINTGISTSGVVTGTLDLKQPMLSPSVGYQFFLSDRFVLDTAAGLSFLFPATATLTTGGSLPAVLPVVPQAQASFQNAQTNIQNQVDAGVKKIRDKIKVLPNLFVAISYLF